MKVCTSEYEGGACCLVAGHRGVHMHANGGTWEKAIAALSTFTKADAGKPPLSRLPRVALEQTARVLAYGAVKYGWENWHECPLSDVRRYHDAALRHIVADANGELLDPESRLPHLAHAIASLMFIMGIREAKFTPSKPTAVPGTFIDE
mgnify:CR=1 FL=1